MLLNKGHSNLQNYGLTLIKACIEDIYNLRNEDVKNTAIAFRIGRFANDRDFQSFINPVKPKKISNDELLSL